MIKLYQFPPAFGLPNPSPFCMKLETYLRMADLPYEAVTVFRPKSGTGKAPYVEIDGEVVTDSSLIITRLEAANGHPVDGKLTLAQRGEALAFQRMLEEHLYWIIVYDRWVAAPADVRADYLASLGVPRLFSSFAAWVGKRMYTKALHNHGLGRHAPDVIWQMGINDIQAVAHWLGTRPYAFGETPTMIDACIAAFVGNIINGPWRSPFALATLKHRTLIDHFARVMTRYFPERIAAE